MTLGGSVDFSEDDQEDLSFCSPLERHFFEKAQARTDAGETMDDEGPADGTRRTGTMQAMARSASRCRVSFR